MRYRPSRLPPEIRRLVEAFRSGLIDALGRNLVGAYLMGSVAFEGSERHAGDVDFHVIVRRPLTSKEKRALEHLHGGLACGHPLGNELDGYYIPLSSARRHRRSTELAFWAGGRMHDNGSDETWALHCAHIQQGAFISLVGPDPRSIYPPASWREIAEELDHELVLLRKVLRRYPVYCTLNLCRLANSWRERNPVVSKDVAGAWALEAVPERWRRLIAAALRSYQGKETEEDVRLVKRSVTGFYEFASDWIEATKPSTRR